MPAPVPDPDPGFTGMTEWLLETYLCAAVLSVQGHMEQQKDDNRSEKQQHPN
jgi:hypothetical protein